jgi:multicomponent Na+:H+ antiporter subunit G
VGLVDVAVMFLMLAGVFFFGVGTLGLWRFPDVFCRAHASTKCDTLGCGLVLLGLAVRTGFTLTSLKLALIVGFIWLTNATAAHVIGRTAFKGNYPKVAGTVKWNYSGRGE